ncbi:MAG: 5-bromo-4-chloroindolyl phosphate hydrolysis family protein [Ruminiclostridium sp.]|nr:5-bromo-4-chloroindolyl phosphate hydrolysis family protein [Ruminiclostridium sp.]
MRALSFTLSLVIGLTFFILFAEGFRTDVSVSAVAGVISFIAGMFMFSSKNKSKEKKPKVKPAPKQNKQPFPTPGDQEFVCDGITRGELNKIVRNGREQVKHIEDIALKIMKHNVRVDILEICTTANDIFDDFVKDPNDIKIARRFILYYLDTTERIVTKYFQLGKAPYLSDDAKKTLQNVEQTLGMIKETFRRQLKKLTENDVLDLDAEVKVLQNTIKQEGI